jgi:CheY-like chemotaxis protein
MSRRILLADDSVTIQKVIELTFMDEDYEVRAVGNGDEALAMLSAIGVDLVIADVHMPGASGYEVCRRSKQQRPDLPVLLLVGTFEPFDESQARECGADSYLKKPFDSQELLGRVHDLLGSRAAAQEPAAAAQPAAAAPAPPPEDTAPVPAAAASAAASAAPAPPAETPRIPGAPPAPAATAPAAPAPVEAASWQELEIEAEPEFMPEPWQPPRTSPGAPSAPATPERYEQPFALGDLDELEAPPAATLDHPFTLGGPLDDNAFLIEEVEEEAVLTAAGEPAAAAGQPAAAAAGEPATAAAGAASQAGTEPAPSVAAPADREAVAPTLEERAGVPAAAAVSGAGIAAAAETSAGTGDQDVLLGSLAQAEQAAADTAAVRPPAAAAAAVAPVNGQPLRDEDVERIARRVVELIGDRVVRDIAWEVIPDLAEVVIKDRLRELESQIE